MANFFLAFEAELAIVTVMNKIDLKVAKPEVVAEQIHNVFDIHPDEIIKVIITSCHLKTSMFFILYLPLELF